MARSPAAPLFPIPPKDYDPRYFMEFVRAFAIYQAQAQNPGEGRNTFTVFTNAPYVGTSGLEVGTVCVDPNGFLKIVMPQNVATVSGIVANGGVGQITKAP